MEENTSERKLKQTVDGILNVQTFIKTRRRTQLDAERDRFYKILSYLEAANDRSNSLEVDFGLGFSKYDDLFFESIDLLLESAYGKDAADIILYYIYDRFNADGTQNTLEDIGGNEVFLDNYLDLWNYILPSIKDFKNNKKHNKLL